MDLGNLDYIEIFRSSFTLMILLVCSILAVAFMIERWLFYRRAKVDSTRFLSRIKMSLENNNFQEAVSTCERDRSPVAAVLRVGLLNRALPYHQLDELMHTTREEERVKLERYLGVLGTLGNSAPFIGLFGTVVGIIKAFHDLAASGSGGPTVVAAGIAEALVATAAGLAVAIPCVMVFNYFMRKVKNIAVEMEAVSKRYLIILTNRDVEAASGRKR
ncbi:MotA/TolQ/ExbB proton channel family protein [bacterium]|nr:MotA/TolQ/ExbB proton channel family protein [bacterium]